MLKTVAVFLDITAVIQCGAQAVQVPCLWCVLTVKHLLGSYHFWVQLLSQVFVLAAECSNVISTPPRLAELCDRCVHHSFVCLSVCEQDNSRNTLTDVDRTW